MEIHRSSTILMILPTFRQVTDIFIHMIKVTQDLTFGDSRSRSDVRLIRWFLVECPSPKHRGLIYHTVRLFIPTFSHITCYAEGYPLPSDARMTYLVMITANKYVDVHFIGTIFTLQFHFRSNSSTPTDE